ncbi:MAG: tRNA methyltransferase [Desulfomicrobium sp.]|jgi:tRNA (guanosine-2'-O-)-methyltransferase|nr:tRNA methyltransferase [Pseudomonadota bacterium]MBV1712169.1 tRNA methyltransferase [Desulfomicrobium sp.]MBU4572807.1 tRNA methyltransferase [Pseudomonadota bacterium]MBU4594802.1 tRNA methyltransferase [Pseudomonadota bacterium]MBV1718559.1 tRNA methyltransferase [Desulfomicrobium sp.]
MPDKFLTEARKIKLRSVLANRQPDLTLVLNNIHDPHNVSAILRSCDAFGVFGVHLYYTKEKFPSLANSSSGSAKKWIDLTRHRDAGTMIAGLREQGMQIVGTGFSPTAKPIMDIDFTRPTAIILGNEHRGMDPDVKVHVPDEIYIPMFGMVQSLNVSVAAATILYEAMRQRLAAGMYGKSPLDADRFEEVYADWCKRGKDY